MRPPELRDLSGGLIPPANDPRWERWTAGLAKFLYVPRTWGALLTWAAHNSVSDVLLKHLLAYLSFTDRIEVGRDACRPIDVEATKSEAA